MGKTSAQAKVDQFGQEADGAEMNAEMDTVFGGADPKEVRASLEKEGYQVAEQEGVSKTDAKKIIDAILARFDDHVNGGDRTSDGLGDAGLLDVA